MTDSLAALTAEIVTFRDARDWAQFHTPRNLAAALLTLAGPGLREIGFVLLGGVTSTRGALLGGAALIVVGAVLRRRALRARGR